MNKKIISIFIITLLALFCTSCENKTIYPSNYSIPEQQTIISFADINELRTFKYTDAFGKVEINRDSNYVTDGDTSAKFTLGGFANSNLKVDMFINSKFKDFSKVIALSLDVFSLSSVERTIEIGFTTRNSGIDRKTYLPEKYVIKPGYNKVVFEIDMAVAKNITYIDKVEYISFAFENPNEDSYVMYFDNLTAHYTNRVVENLVKNYKENEILFFDEKIDRFYVTSVTTFATAIDIHEVTINRDPFYIKSGLGSLKVKQVVNTVTQGSSGLSFSGEPISRIDFSEYSHIQVSIMLDKDLPGNSNVNMGVYDENGALVMSCEHLRNVREGVTDDPNHFAWGVVIPKNTWYTLDLDINVLLEAGLDLEKIQSINFYLGIADSEEDAYNLYIDDFKLIK